MPISSKECAQKKSEIDDLKNFFLFFCHKLDVRYATKSRKKFFSGDIFYQIVLKFIFQGFWTITRCTKTSKAD